MLLPGQVRTGGGVLSRRCRVGKAERRDACPRVYWFIGPVRVGTARSQPDRLLMEPSTAPLPTPRASAISPAPGAVRAFGVAAMTGTTRSSDGLDARRRRILFRSWHR